MNNAPRHPKTQIGLYQPGVWQGADYEITTIDDTKCAVLAIYVVDQAIERAKEESK